jgi:hypothetical protein
MRVLLHCGATAMELFGQFILTGIQRAFACTDQEQTDENSCVLQEIGIIELHEDRHFQYQ